MTGYSDPNCYVIVLKIIIVNSIIDEKVSFLSIMDYIDLRSCDFTVILLSNSKLR